MLIVGRLLMALAHVSDVTGGRMQTVMMPASECFPGSHRRVAVTGLSQVIK